MGRHVELCAIHCHTIVASVGRMYSGRLNSGTAEPDPTEQPSTTGLYSLSIFKWTRM